MNAKAKPETKVKEQQQTAQQEMPRQRQAVATLQPTRLPYNPVYEERYGISGMTWRALVDAVYPSAKTVEGIILAVSYCQSKNYDVMKKFVHVVPIWSTQLKREVEGVWESVAALRATAFRTGEYAGCEETKFGPQITRHFEGTIGKDNYAKNIELDLEFPEWAQVTVYRLVQGIRCAFPGPKVLFLGAYGTQGKSDVPNDKWSEGGGSYMLEKCAEAAALRKAFPEALGSMNAAEEMYGRRVDAGGAGPIVDNDPAPPRPRRTDPKAEAAAAQRQAQEMDESFHGTMGRTSSEEPDHDAETGEVIENADEEQGPGHAQQDSEPAADTTPAAQSQARDKTAAPAKQPPQVDYAAMTKTLIDKINKAGTLKSFNVILQEYGPDIDGLPETFAASVQTAIAEKKKWFSRD